MGRPAKIDDDKLKAICRLKPTLADCAAFFGVTESAILKHVEKKHGKSYSSFREENMVDTRFMLVRTALEQAKKGNTAMIIFCLKNICKWKDRHEVSGDETAPLKLSYDPAKLPE